jgi:hypothetical protein
MLNMFLKWQNSRYFLGRYREFFISLSPQIKNPLSQKKKQMKRNVCKLSSRRATQLRM